jgi:hypothetical protein
VKYGPPPRPGKNKATVKVSYRLGQNTYPDVIYLDRGNSRAWSLASLVGGSFTATSPIAADVRSPNPVRAANP